MSYPSHPLLTPLLALPAALYGAVMRLRNRRFDRPGVARKAALPVISVGNLTVGGTGKTPTVAWLARRLLAEGRRPAVVSRGYGGRAGRGPLTVAAGDGPQVAPELCGDEPWWLARQVSGLRVVVGSDRIAGAAAARRLDADVVLLDDGFQHRRLARDLDIVLLDAAVPFGNGRLLPAGPLRESPTALGRADLLLATRVEPGADVAGLAALATRYAPGVPLLLARHRPLAFVDLDGTAVTLPPRVAAFCGIARPESFRRSLVEAGVELARFFAFPDHHAYSASQLDTLVGAAREAGVPLVTTEKDLARIGRRAGDRILALAVELEIADDAPLLAAVANALRAGTEGRR